MTARGLCDAIFRTLDRNRLISRAGLWSPVLNLRAVNLRLGSKSHETGFDTGRRANSSRACAATALACPLSRKSAAISIRRPAPRYRSGPESRSRAEGLRAGCGTRARSVVEVRHALRGHGDDECILELLRARIIVSDCAALKVMRRVQTRNRLGANARLTERCENYTGDLREVVDAKVGL
jgi:hypothetical protein